MMMHPRLIAIEGLPRAGKSVFISDLAKQAEAKGFKVKIVKWNSVQQIRKLISTLNSGRKMTPLRYSVLQWCAFIVTYNLKVLPSLRRGELVICDRYIYTAFTRDINNCIGLRRLFSLYQSCLRPKIVVYIDVIPELCFLRISQTPLKPLFHLSEAVQISNAKAPDLLYLRNLRASYEHLLFDSQIMGHTKIVRVSEKIQVSRKIRMLLNDIAAPEIGPKLTEDSKLQKKCTQTNAH